MIFPRTETERFRLRMTRRRLLDPPGNVDPDLSVLGSIVLSRTPAFEADRKAIVPRQKSFDEHETLRAIGQLFWRNGYTATGMDEICTQVSLTKPSIYNAFGDKAALFRAVVDWYADDMLERGAAVLRGEAPVTVELAALLRNLLVVPDPEIVSRGCLLTTTMMELQHSEPELFEYVRTRIDRVPEAINAYLSRARDAGLLRGDSDPAALSEYFVTVLQGLRMQSRTSGEHVNLDRIISIAMGPIEAAEPATERARVQ